MPTYEYVIDSWGHQSRLVVEEINALMNKRAADGWELVSHTLNRGQHSQTDVLMTFVFKRPS
jgi:hypothetical protein